MNYSFLEHRALNEQPAEVDDCYCLLFGSLFVQVQRHTHEWRVEYAYGRPAAGKHWLVFSEARLFRLVASSADCTLSARLRIADRPIVSRPAQALEILPGNTAILYIGTVLWVSIWVDEHQLVELPPAQLSDTWFGPNTYEGELCYASSTRARLNAALLDPVPFKAVTPVMIHNRSADKLSLERLNLPVPYLKLFEVNGQYWTSSVQVIVEADLNRAKVDIDTDNLRREGERKELAEPRKGGGKGVLDKAINLLLA